MSENMKITSATTKSPSAPKLAAHKKKMLAGAQKAITAALAMLKEVPADNVVECHGLIIQIVRLSQQLKKASTKSQLDQIVKKIMVPYTRIRNYAKQGLSQKFTPAPQPKDSVFSYRFV